MLIASFPYSFINNEFRKGVDGKTIEVINPSTEKVIVSVHEATEKDVDIAVAAARKAFEGSWRTVTPDQRGKYLVKLADLFEQNLEQLAAIESLDNGKAFNMAKVDITMAAGCLRYYGGWADKIEGKVIETNSETFNYTKQEPVSPSPPSPNRSTLCRLINQVDWRVCPNHSMELSSSDVGMENRSCYRLWQRRRSQIGRTNTPRRSLRCKTGQRGWLSPRGGECSLWLRARCRCSVIFPHGCRQGRIYRQHRGWPTSHEGCGKLESQKGYPRTGRQEPEHCLRGRGYR